jgi:hypothetical protein
LPATLAEVPAGVSEKLTLPRQGGAMDANHWTIVAVGSVGFIIFLIFRRWLWLIVLPPVVAILFYVILNTIYGVGR